MLTQRISYPIRMVEATTMVITSIRFLAEGVAIWDEGPFGPFVDFEAANKWFAKLQKAGKVMLPDFISLELQSHTVPPLETAPEKVIEGAISYMRGFFASPTEGLDVSPWTRRALRANGGTATVCELARCTERELKSRGCGFGPKVLEELRELLRSWELAFGMPYSDKLVAWLKEAKPGAMAEVVAVGE